MLKCLPITLILLALLAWPARAAKDDPAELFRAAQRAEAAGDTLNAFLLYSRASILAPDNAEYFSQRTFLQGRVNQLAQISLAEMNEEERMAFRIESEELTPTEAIEGRRSIRPPRLRDPGSRRDFDLRGTARPLWEALGEAFGLTVRFPQDYQSSAATAFRIRQVTMEQAIRILETVTSSFVVVVSETQVIVFNETQQNRTDNVPVITVAIPIPERFSIQDAQELASGIQQTMELRRIAVDAGRRVIFIRDQESKVMGARKILADLIRHRAQVAIEIEFLSTSQNSTLTYGMSLPTVVPVQNFGDFLNNTAGSVNGITNFATFGGGATLTGLGIADAAGYAMLSRSSSESLLRTQMTALDGQQVTLHIGDRFPIVTGRYGDPSGGTDTTPITQYVDIGLILKATPVVHAGGEMSLALEAEYSVLGATQNNGIPIISSRKFQSTTRMEFGQWGILTGFATTVTTDEKSGVPLLSKLPLVGRFFRRNKKVVDSGQVMVVIKPHLTEQGPWEEPSRAMYVGTESKPLSVF